MKFYVNIVVAMRYIGCKRLLLKEIGNVINENIKDANVFCDIFSGTCTVANYFKSRYRIISNDILYFSYILQEGVIKNNRKPAFKKLREKLSIIDPIEYFNNVSEDEILSLPEQQRFFLNNYSPKGNRMYLSCPNALKIDFIRNKIEEWKEDEIIQKNEYFYLIASLIEAIPFVSNIAGTYGAYHKWWDKRALNDIVLKDLDIRENYQENEVYNLDGNKLIENISGDILYIDPPYNNRQYPPNYHVLETAALYDFPELKGVTGQRDYSDKKSLYCNKSTVADVFRDLIKKADFKHIVMSYSTEGLMDMEVIENILCEYGKADTLKVYEIPYRRFKSKKIGTEKELSELIFYIRKFDD